MTNNIKPDIDYRITLRNSSQLSESITFEASPDLIETRNVNYRTVDPVHAPGQIVAYGNTSSRTFNISSVKLISRTSNEALQNLQYLWLLRSWTTPQFGQTTLTREQLRQRERANRDPSDFRNLDDTERAERFGVEERGRPPAVLLLSAYSRDSAAAKAAGDLNAFAGHINRVPVVIQNLSIPYPADIDYIPTTGTNIPMPTIMTIDMTLMETHSPREYERFDLASFKVGRLGGF